METVFACYEQQWVPLEDYGLASFGQEIRPSPRGLGKEDVLASAAFVGVVLTQEQAEAWRSKPVGDQRRVTHPVPLIRPACPQDTDGDGNCGRPLCRVCGVKVTLAGNEL